MLELEENMNEKKNARERKKEIHTINFHYFQHHKLTVNDE